jgi:hypothetical protein
LTSHFRGCIGFRRDVTTFYTHPDTTPKEAMLFSFAVGMNVKVASSLSSFLENDPGRSARYQGRGRIQDWHDRGDSWQERVHGVAILGIRVSL